MRIAITNPFTQAYLRRGAERFSQDLAAFLHSRGHDVTLIAAQPGRSEMNTSSGYRALSFRRLWLPALARIGIHEHHAFFWPVLQALLRGRYEVVVSCQYMDALAASLARSFTGVPCVFAFVGMPPQVIDYRSLSLGGRFIRSAVRRANTVMCPSGYVESYLTRRWQVPSVRIPVPVNTRLFCQSGERDHGRPVILCAAALYESRKGGRLLMRAFDLLKARRPEPVLQIVYPLSAEVRHRLLELVSPQWRDDVQFLPDAGNQLPALYGKAAISVLPSLWEAYGLVVLESMATGTPVVGTRSGALPELITHPGVGRLFDPGDAQSPEPTNAVGLMEAMAECLDLSRRPETSERCRQRAEECDWSRLGPRFEALILETARSSEVAACTSS